MMPQCGYSRSFENMFKSVPSRSIYYGHGEDDGGFGVGADFSWRRYSLFPRRSFGEFLEKPFACAQWGPKIRILSKVTEEQPKIMGQDDDQVRPHGHYTGWLSAVKIP